jgi:type III pantothenate kinase
MRVAAVADVGNSRIKWGRCSPSAVTDRVTLPPDAPDAWAHQLDAWHLSPDTAWVVSGVHPARLGRLVDWLRGRGTAVLVLDHWQQLPLRVLVDQPGRVGLDRLLGAVAANSVRHAGCTAVVVDAGSAITVNAVDSTGAFRGGVILPGLYLMARALHDYTALLPLVDPPPGPPPPGPATSSETAIAAGVYWAAAGAVRAIVQQWQAADRAGPPPHVFLTGGDAPRLAPALDPSWRLWPAMTLEGIRLAAEALP